ncbi:MAG: hypothetical protein PGN21_00845 [Sphingomonas paucimobilis]
MMPEPAMTTFFGLFAALALAACGNPDAGTNRHDTAVGNQDAGPTLRKTTAPTTTETSGDRLMSASKPCGTSEMERSACMVELILADLKANYTAIGGGITSIKAGPGMSYSVALPQEERTDIRTYTFTLNAGVMTIADRRDTTESY